MSSQIMATLFTRDNCEIPVSLEAAKQSVVLRTMLEEVGYTEAGAGIPIPIPAADGKTMEKVVEWCEHHRNDPIVAEKDGDEGLNQIRNEPGYETTIPEWDAKFLEAADGPMIKEILKAADYLEIPLLEHYTVRIIADRIRGMSTQQMRDFFNIESDYTPEEEEEAKNVNSWVGSVGKSKPNVS
jgi:S-phase kinase-associated protein 1